MAVAFVVDHHRSFHLFVEMTEVLPFSQDVATILGDAIAELRKRGLRKVAHISPSTLANIQIRRISQRHEDSRFFSDNVAASRWMSDGEHRVFVCMQPGTLTEPFLLNNSKAANR